MTTRALPAAWSVLERAMATERSVECLVTHVVPGGLQVLLDSMIGFLPQSQIELGASHPLESYLGKSLRCHVLRMHANRSSIVVGRNKLLRENKQQRQDAALRKMQPGTLVAGTIKNLTSYGAFVDLDGIDGLIKNHEMAWGKCQHAHEHVQVGQTVVVKVVAIHCIERHIELSLRQAQPDPWDVARTWHTDMRREGTVVNRMDYGYFVRLIDGVEGLLHVNNVPAGLPALALNSRLDVVLVSVDAQKKRIALGLPE